MSTKAVGRYEELDKKQNPERVSDKVSDIFHPEDPEYCRKKEWTVGRKKYFIGLLAGFAAELYLDCSLGFPRGILWLPAFVMLWICLSILMCAAFEGLLGFVWKAMRTFLLGISLESRIKIWKVRTQDRNNCSFPENVCILKAERRRVNRIFAIRFRYLLITK